MIPMDHAYAEEHGLVESYLKDRLSESEREAFEAHYFACETCLAQLEATSDFREGMLQVAAEDTTRAAAVHAQLGLLAGLALLSRGRRLALAGLLLLLLALPLGLLVANRGLEHRLDEAQVRTPRQTGAAGPQINLPIYTLAAVRGGEDAGRDPVNRIPLSSTTGSIILNLELATIDFPSYRASLRAEGGQEIWQAGGLRPDSRDSLTLLLPSSMLAPGIYRLTIEGMKDGGQGFAVAAYPFRVERAR
ncbi:MAG TPA: zf-HC2 domain-containing protein [Thermoanaerobaculia bacterium]|jgi:hypothetical protein|nr:zf-HC2 domain-containing protein [Thermoanaerobaculia bacterium]